MDASQNMLLLLAVGALGYASGTITTLVLTERARRLAKRFESVMALALHQNESMQGIWVRGPCGQDWCDLYDEIQPNEKD